MVHSGGGMGGSAGEAALRNFVPGCRRLLWTFLGPGSRGDLAAINTSKQAGQTLQAADDDQHEQTAGFAETQEIGRSGARKGGGASRHFLA